MRSPNAILRSTKSKCLAGVGAAALIAASFAIPAQAQANDQSFVFDLPAQSLDASLREFGVVADRQVMFTAALVADQTADALSGDMTALAALETLLADSGLTYQLTTSGVILIVDATAEADDAENAGTPSGTFRTAAVTGAGARSARQPVEDVAETDEEGEGDQSESEPDVIVVTGTNIRGAAPDSSPSFVFSQEDIELSGASTLQEFIRTIPQSFGGGAQAGVLSLPNDDLTTSNPTASSSLNLRGLGSGSTLVLLNGRRIAPGGSLGAFTDISMIPVSAIERIEMITDGASAIYGADAVGGVVNIVLRDDYAGVQTFAGVGSDSGGDVIEYRAGATAGRAWRGGNLIASYEFSNRGALSVADREFSAATPTPNVLMPEQEVQSGLVSISQDVGSHLSLQAEATHSERTTGNRARNVRRLFIIDSTSEVDQSGLSLEAIVDVSDEWQVSATAAHNRHYSYFSRSFFPEDQFISDSVNEAEIWSFAMKADGPLFALPGGIVRAAIGSEYREEKFEFSLPSRDRVFRRDQRDVSSAYAEVFVPVIGEANRVPGVQRLEFTVAGRQDSYSDFGDAFSPKLGVLWGPSEHLTLRSTYGESFNPPDLGRTGATSGGSVLVEIVSNNASPTGSSVVIVDSRSPDLGPEESTSWTLGVDYDRQIGSGHFQSSITWYDISYVDRIGRPGSIRIFLNNPDVFEALITPNPDPDVISALINDPTVLFRDFSGGAWAAPGDEEFLLDGRIINLASQDTSGIDIDLSYEIEPPIGQLSLDLNAAYIIEQVQRVTPTAAALDVIDTIFRPADFRVRAGVTWSLDQWTVAGFLNHVDSYTDNRDLNGFGDVQVDAWTTFDLNLTYRTGGQRHNALLNDINITLNARNLFNEAPPRIAGSADNFAVRQGYDPANADPLGRFVTLRVTKEW